MGGSSILALLDDDSLAIFLRKAAGRVCAISNKERGWTQLIESINEVRAYEYALSLGYPTVRFLDESSSLPDIEAIKAGGIGLVEAKTINESDLEISLRGKVQMGELGLPLRLTRAIRKAYKQACNQIGRHPTAESARRVCFMVINLDLITLLENSNKSLLEEFVAALQKRVEIVCVSRYWPATSTSCVLRKVH